jgi:hypothetical protein
MRSRQQAATAGSRQPAGSQQPHAMQQQRGRSARRTQAAACAGGGRIAGAVLQRIRGSGRGLVGVDYCISGLASGHAPRPVHGHSEQHSLQA